MYAALTAGYGKNFHGAQKILFEIAVQNQAAGHRLTFLEVEPGLLSERLRAVGVEVVALPRPIAAIGLNRPFEALVRITASPLDLARFWVSLWRWVHSAIPSVLHANDLRSLLLVGPVARLCGVPIVWHVHGRSKRSFRRVGQLASRMLVSEAIIVSKDLADDVSSRSSMRLIRYPVATSGLISQTLQPESARKRDTRRSAREGESVLKVVCVTSLYPRKGLHVLQDAAALIEAGVVEIDVWADPDRGLPPYVAMLLSRNALASTGSVVNFRGWTDNPLAVMRDADLLVLPSSGAGVLELPDSTVVNFEDLEGQPLVLLEALSVGTPVLATRVTGVSDLEEYGEGIIVVPPNDPQALADALKRAARDRPTVSTNVLRTIENQHATSGYGDRVRAVWTEATRNSRKPSWRVRGRR